LVFSGSTLHPDVLTPRGFAQGNAQVFGALLGHGSFGGSIPASNAQLPEDLLANPGGMSIGSLIACSNSRRDHLFIWQ
jgi:hypothetical protein